MAFKRKGGPFMRRGSMARTTNRSKQVELPFVVFPADVQNLAG